MKSSAMVSCCSARVNYGLSVRMAIGVLGALALMALGFSTSGAQEIPLPGQRLLSDIDQIELTYTDKDAFPTVALVGRQSSDFAVPSSYRPVLPILDLFPVMDGGRAFGPCRLRQESERSRIHVSFAGDGGQRCGLMWSIKQQDKVLDGLSYDTLWVKGTATGALTIALTDEAGYRRQDNVAVARVTGPFDVQIPLKQFTRRLDMRQLAALILLVNGETDVTLEEASLQSSPLVSSAPALGFWFWDYRAAIHDPKAMIASCLHHGCRRLLLQMPDLRDADPIWAAYAELFPLVEAAHIELFALDGYPEAIQDPVPLADKVNRLLSLTGGRGLAGVQLDIEPYLLPGFFDDETGFDRYLAAIDRVKAALDGRARLSVVMPFWFTATLFKDRPIACAVMDRVDDVAVMSYRTDAEEVLKIADDMLRYGRLAGVPVWLALETTRLPVERHVVLKRESRGELADGFLDEGRRTLVLGKPEAGSNKPRLWVRIHHRFTVRPERLTFAERSRSDIHAAMGEIFSRAHQSSLAGILLHDLAGYMALQE